MSHRRRSAEAQSIRFERRATERERSIIRRSERHSKVAQRVMFGGAR